MGERKRIESLDILRGFSMFFSAGGDELMIALCVALGFSADCGFAQQFVHVPWHGAHFEDFIYPLFVFIAGVTWPLSLARQRERGMTTGQIVRKVLLRGLMLIVLGCLYHQKFLNHGVIVWATVLGRIGVCWALAALVWTFASMRMRAAVFAGILVSYWLLLEFVPAPGAPAGADPLARDMCLVTWLNDVIPPTPSQWVLSVYPMVATALAGMFAGAWLTCDRPGLTEMRRTLVLAGAGGLAALAGAIWAWGLGPWSFPLNKIIWSSSHVLVAGGLSAMLLALVHWIVDMKGFARWGFFLKVVGVNCILFYVLVRGILPLKTLGGFYFGGLAKLFPPQCAEFIHFAGGMLLYWILLLFLYRKKIFLKV